MKELIKKIEAAHRIYRDSHVLFDHQIDFILKMEVFFNENANPTYEQVLKKINEIKSTHA